MEDEYLHLKDFAKGQSRTQGYQINMNLPKSHMSINHTDHSSH